MHLTLFRYLVKHFLKSILITFLVIIIAISIADFLELLRRSSNATNIDLTLLVMIILLKLPFFIQETYPFIIFIAAIYSFFQLSKNNEYIMMKASGFSIWQFIFPYILIGLVFSIIVVTILNPISAKFLLQEKKNKVKLLSNNKENTFTLLDSGLWFVDRTADENVNIIIHANKLLITENETKLIETSFTYIDKKYSFIKQIKAKEAFLILENWILHDVTEYLPKQKNNHYNEYKIFTATTPQELHNSFIKPKYISVWDLPYFISVLQQSGHSAKEYIIVFYKILIKPFVTITLLFIAAIFCLKSFRIFKPTYLIISSLLGAFFTYCIIELTLVTTINSSISPISVATLLVLFTNIIAITSLKYSEK